MVARPWILVACAAAAATLLGVQPEFAQPSAAPPAPARPQVGLIADDLQKLIARLRMCWAPPIASAKGPDVVVRLHVRFKPDGSLAEAPTVVNSSQAPLFPAAAQSAVRAVTKCAPFSFLPAAKYELWRDIEVSFDPGTFADLKPK
jgi:colicin import membrane protein